MSDGIGLTTILGCLSSGEPVMGVSPADWESCGNSPHQDYFASNQLSWRPGLSHFRGDSLRSFAHIDLAEVAMKMREWNMRLPTPPPTPGGVYMISQYRELLKWMEEGKELNDVFDWPVFWLKQGVSFFSSTWSNDPVVQIMTQEGDFVYLVRAKTELRGMEILYAVNKIMAGLGASRGSYDGVQVPFVYADMDPDLSWLLGFRNKGWFVSYAKQKILFGMNHIGFAVREEASVITMKAIIPNRNQPYVLSPDGEPFLFWRLRSGVGFPLSVFQFTKGDFKDPGDLENIIA